MEPSREEELARLFAEGRYDVVLTRLLAEEGPALLGFLTATLRDPGAADEVYAAATEAAWEALPRFEARASFRTWLYAVARRCAARYRRDRARRREAPCTSPPERHAEARTATSPWQRTDVRDRFAALRERLDEEDLELLVLRVDRQLRWDEVAAVLAPDESSPAARKRAAATLRKRFQLLVERIREEARASRLFEDPSP